MEQIYGWIKNIVIYMLLNTIIMNLLGNKSYKKYASIVSGMILVLIVISPVMQLMQLDDKLDYYLKFNDFNVDTIEFRSKLSAAEEEQRADIFGKYEDKITEQIKELLINEGIYPENIEIKTDRDASSSSFGKITDIYIVAKAGQERAEKNSTRIRIDEIEVVNISIGRKAESDERKAPSPLEISIKNKLSGFYNLKQGNINISIQGG